MMYIIEYSDNRWKAIMPEIVETEFGVEYTNYTHDSSAQLNTILDMMYDHRAIYNNWEAQIFINGNQVLCTEIKDGVKWVRFYGGSMLKVDQIKAGATDSLSMQDIL